MSVGIGDLTQIPVSTRPIQVMPAIPGGGSVTLYNQDVTNIVWISRVQWFKPGDFNSIPIQPLTPGTFTTSKTLYAASTVAGVAPLAVLPEGGSLNPSPAQIAANIAASGLALDTSVNNPAYGPSTLVRQITQETNIPNNIALAGVPLRNLGTTGSNVTGQAIAAGVTFTASTITNITQAAFNLHITATCNGAATKPWFTVKLNWIDSGTGLTVQVDAYTSFMSNTASALTTIISGPTDADSLQIQITNNDTLSMTVNQMFCFLSSRPNYTTDFYYHFWAGTTMPNIPTFQNGSSDAFPTNRVIFDISRNLGIGLTTTPDYTLPSYAGQAMFSFAGFTSNQWQINMFNAVTGTRFLTVSTGGSGVVQPFAIILPRMPIHLNFTNNGSVLGALNLVITAV